MIIILDFKEFMPNAVCYKIDNMRPQRLYTYDSCLTLDKANEAIAVWNKDRRRPLLFSWVVEKERGKDGSAVRRIIEPCVYEGNITELDWGGYKP